MALRRVAKFCILSICQLLLLPSTLCMAQNSMSSTGSGSWASPAFVSSFTDCASPGTTNCWWLSSGLGSRINASYGGYIVKLDSSGCASLYNSTANTWTAQTAWGCGLQKVLKGGDGNIYALTGPCNGVQYGIAKRVGSSWVMTPGCGADFSLDQTGGGMSVNIDPGGGLWASTNYFTTSTEIHGCLENGHGWAISVAMLDPIDRTFYSVCQDNTIWKGTWNGVNSTVTYTQLPGLGTLVAAALPRSVYILGTDNHAYHLKSNNTWETLVSYTFTHLSVGDDMNVWAVGPTTGGHNDYVFMEQSVQFTRNYNGTVSCAQGVPQSLCNTFKHSASAQICFGQNACGVVANAPGWNGNGSWGVSPTVTAHPQDIFDCLYSGDPGDCVIAETSGHMQCSGGGSNNDNGSQGSGSVSRGYTLLQKASGGAGYNLGNGWAYTSAPYCSNTQTPLWNPNFVIARHSGDIAWLSHGWCFNVWGFNVCNYDYYQAGPYTGLGTDTIDKEYPALQDPGPSNQCTPQ